MRKPKQRDLKGGPVINNKQAAPLSGSQNSERGVDLAREDDWVMVKMQKVVILVSPMTDANESTMQEPVPTEKQAIPTTALNVLSQHQVERAPTKQQSHPTNAVNELSLHLVEKCKRSKSQASRGAQIVRKENPDDQAVRFELSDTNVRVQSQSPEQVGMSRDIKGPPQKFIIQPRHSHGPRCLLGGSLLNKRMRATNLERRLQKAGGLNKWLASLGLDQFIKIFEMRSFSRFELVNLTMKKLKDMGAGAVGPRRKLMHAIACLS